MAKNDDPSENLTEPIPECWFEEVRKRAIEMSAAVGTNFIEQSRPQVAARALWMLAQGVSKSAISKNLGIDRATVYQLNWRHSDTLETKRKEFSRKYAQVAERFTDLLFVKAERILDDETRLDNISPDKLALTVAIMTDKSAQLSGMPGVIIEHRRGTSMDDAMLAIAAAKARVAGKLKSIAIEAEVIS